MKKHNLQWDQTFIKHDWSNRERQQKLPHYCHTFCFRSTKSSPAMSFRGGTVTIPLFSCSNSSFKLRISLWYFLMSDFSSIIYSWKRLLLSLSCRSIAEIRKVRSIKPCFVMLEFRCVLHGGRTSMCYEFLLNYLMKELQYKWAVIWTTTTHK